MAAFAGDEKLRKVAEKFLAPHAASEHAPVARKASKALKALRAR